MALLDLRSIPRVAPGSGGTLGFSSALGHLPWFVWPVLGFAAGAIPFGVLVARRVAGLDIKAHGSGNIGATNVARVVGIVPGLIVLVLDAAKGALPLAIALRCTGEPAIGLLTGGAAILGHCFSPLLGFRGGKGVATAFGVFVVLTPGLAALAAGVFVIVAAATRVPALGSLAGVATIAIALIVARDTDTAAFAVATALLLVYTHRKNLATLVRRARRPR
ncbi:MAG TPA: glycerol-3-phosphate acyltransferase [Kofleriaceae bacterium]|nr:glycerol-3-phosphate acyltransferase [Kofleriaceae bacterium]